MKEIFCNKKGFSSYMLWWIIFKLSFAIAVCVVTLILVQNTYSNIDYGSRGIDARVIGNSLMHSSILMYEDDVTGRLYAGHIDMEKWNNKEKIEEELEEYLVTGDIDYIAMKITLFYGNKNESVYYNKNKYLEWGEFYQGFDTAIEGYTKTVPGGYDYEWMKFPVTIGDYNSAGVLAVELIMPNG